MFLHGVKWAQIFHAKYLPVIDKQRKLLYNFQMKHIDLFGQKDVVLYILCFSCCQTKLPFKRAEERKKYI